MAVIPVPAHRPLHSIELMAAGEFSLLCGNYNLGWRMFEMRLAPEMRPRTPIYLGGLAGLVGRDVIVRAELGAGDSFMMMRYFPALKEHSRCNRLILEAPAGMEDFYRAFFPDFEVCRFGLSSRRDVVQVPLMSLPILLSGVLGWEPIAPLAVPREFVRQRDGLGLVPACEVTPGGQNWRGNKRARKNPPRELLDTLGPVMDLSHEALGKCSWYETAKVMAGLELIITIDSGPAHLAASLGVPTWVLQRHLSDGACWRWGCPDPWYPGVARVFQQTTAGDWTGPIDAVRDALRERIH